LLKLYCLISMCLYSFWCFSCCWLIASFYYDLIRYKKLFQLFDIC
jgi:hypothetical protein